MDTELPPQESEGKVASKFNKLDILFYLHCTYNSQDGISKKVDFYKWMS